MGVAIPASFLIGILALALTGLTINVVVLFSLILAAGMLVDGAIVLVEYADRKMIEGLPKRDAFRAAATRMAWPITSSLSVTIVVFLPLIFWPGVVGEFMKYLPITLTATLLGLAGGGHGVHAGAGRHLRQGAARSAITTPCAAWTRPMSDDLAKMRGCDRPLCPPRRLG